MPRARHETSAGGVLFRCTEAGPRYLLIRDAYEKWGFPKGHVDPGESPAAAARREVREETGLDDLVLHEGLGQIDWYFRFRGRLIHKVCHLFLFQARRGEARPQGDEGISACGWYEADAALATISYVNARSVLERAAELVPRLCGGSGGA